MSFSLKMDVGGFSKHQKKAIDNDRYKKYFFTARVSQVNVNTMKRLFEQQSELQIAKCLSSGYNVSRFELRNKKKATQQWSLRVAHDIVLNQVRVYHESAYADNVISKFWFVRSFSSQLYSKFITNVVHKMCCRSVVKNARPDPSFAK